MSPLRRENADNEFVQERVPLIVCSMDVGTVTVVGRTIRGVVRSPRFADALIAGGMRAVRVVIEVERVDDAD